MFFWEISWIWFRIFRVKEVIIVWLKPLPRILSGSISNLNIEWIKYAELEGTHGDPRVQFPALPRTAPAVTPCARALSKPIPSRVRRCCARCPGELLQGPDTPWGQRPLIPNLNLPSFIPFEQHHCFSWGSNLWMSQSQGRSSTNFVQQIWKISLGKIPPGQVRIGAVSALG